MIVTLVSINTTVVSVKSGVIFTSNIFAERPDWAEIFSSCLFLIIVPFIYHGLLGISYNIHDPFGEDVLDFPVAAYLEYEAKSCSASIQGSILCFF